MGLISKAIPTLLRGVSQAADNTKQADHADIQDNADSNPVTGLTKRSGLQYITNLSTSTLGNVHIQTINRDVNERYVAIFSNGDVKVYDIDGTEKTVHKPDGTTYLNTSDPRSVMKTVSVADFTFVVNTSITTAMDSTLTTGPIYNDGSSDIGITNQAIVFVNQVSANTQYTLEVDGRKCVYDSGTADLRTDRVADFLDGILSSNDNQSNTTETGTPLTIGTAGNTFNISRNGSVIRIFKNDNSDFNIQVSDSQGNSQLTLVKDSIQRFTDLPTVAPNGYVVEVKGDDQTNFDNYYVKFVTNNTTADGTLEEGQWEETAKLGIEKKFDYSTMPHVLVRQADGNFRFARVDGDNYTALLKTGTYVQSGTTVTVTSNNHGFGTLQNLTFDFQTGTSVDGTFPITRVDANTFTFTAASSLSTSGSVFFNHNGAINGSYTQSENTATITSHSHGFSTGDKVTLNFTRESSTHISASNKMVDGEYTITVVNTDSFTVDRTENTSIGIDNGYSATGKYTYNITGDQSLPKWGERTVGDLDSAPNPSFIGSKINNVFFFRNRLGFLANDNVILSRAAEFFNFFPETVLSVIDSEPIDVAASHTKVAILRSAVTVEQELILFSDQTQFVLTSSTDNLTPRTANVVVVTEFESDDNAQPVGAGSSIYYLSKRGSFANVREYVYQRDLVIREASNITVHVPKLIPSNIFKFAVSTSADVLVCLGTDEPNKLYINRWIYGQQYQKILNSWFTFTINENRSIKNVDFIGSDLFLVIEEANGITLEKIPFENQFTEANATFEYRLDHKVTEATTGVSVDFNPSTHISTFTVPYKLRANMNIVGRFLGSGETSTFVNAQGTTTTLKPGQIISTTNSTDGSTSTITATGDFRNSKFIIGEPYEMHYRFSQQRLTAGSGGQAGGEFLSGRLQLHHFYIKFEDTGFFKVEVTPDSRDTSTHNFTGVLLGTGSSTIGTVNLESGFFKVPVMSRADRVNIDVKNNTFLPTTLASAEYEAMFHMRSRRI